MDTPLNGKSTYYSLALRPLLLLLPLPPQSAHTPPTTIPNPNANLPKREQFGARLGAIRWAGFDLSMADPEQPKAASFFARALGRDVGALPLLSLFSLNILWVVSSLSIIVRSMWLISSISVLIDLIALIRGRRARSTLRRSLWLVGVVPLRATLFPRRFYREYCYTLIWVLGICFVWIIMGNFDGHVPFYYYYFCLKKILICRPLSIKMSLISWSLQAEYRMLLLFTNPWKVKVELLQNYFEHSFENSHL